MKSFVFERHQELILELVLGRISDAEFLAASNLSLGQLEEEVSTMLAIGLRDHDAQAVEMGLHLGHRFGFQRGTLDTLSLLSDAGWHERHEDVVDAIAKVAAPESVAVLGRAALATLPYREYDDARSLRVKAIRALGALESLGSVSVLRQLAQSGNQIAAAEAKSWLDRLALDAESQAVRTAALLALHQNCSQRAK